MNLTLGISFGLSTTALWAWASVVFQGVVHRHGALGCSVFKTVVATAMFWGAVGLWGALGGVSLPGCEDALILMATGIAGMTLGDLAFFGAISAVGVRQATLLQGTSPVFLLAFSFLAGEPPREVQQLGIALVVLGVWSVTRSRRLRLPSVSVGRGVLLGLSGALGQAVAVHFSHGPLTRCDALSGSAFRLLGATLGFVAILPAMGRVRWGIEILSRRALYRDALPAVFLGTFVAVCLQSLAIRNAPPAVSGTLLSLTPILVLPISAFMLKRGIPVAALLGSLIAFAGVVLLSWPASPS